jgi:transposase
MPGRPLPALMLARGEKAALRELERGPAGLALRARIILACAAGRTNQDVAAALGTSVQTVGKWRARFLAQRLDGLRDRPRAGAPRSIEDAAIETVIVRALETKPAGATRWSARLMAKATGMSASSVQRIWRAFGLRPHRAESFALSADPDFAATVRDIVGLYLSRPDRALVLCVDGRRRAAVRGRAEPILAMPHGRAGRRPLDPRGIGFVSLFVALDRATGRAVGARRDRHRSDERRGFIDAVERAAPAGLELRLVAYVDGNRETALVRDWRARRPHDPVHLAPTYAAWLNQVARWSALLAERRRGVIPFESAVAAFIDRHGAAPAPFSWIRPAQARAIIEGTSGSKK